jgi:hypothetical protein
MKDQQLYKNISLVMLFSQYFIFTMIGAFMVQGWYINVFSLFIAALVIENNLDYFLDKFASLKYGK